MASFYKKSAFALKQIIFDKNIFCFYDDDNIYNLMFNY